MATEKTLTLAEKCYRLSDGRELTIAQNIDGFVPPDTGELKRLCNSLTNIANRIHSLRFAVLLNDAQEKSRIRRVIAGRKLAIEKAYKKGLKDGRSKKGAKP